MKKYKIQKGDEVISTHTTELEAIKSLKEVKLPESSITEAIEREDFKVVPFLEKEKDHAFNKDVYLLGEDEEGIKYWLEAPSWDCGWYWGFGYIETYQNNRKPSLARDIDGHQHAEGFYRKWWNSDEAILKLTTFTEAEGWELSELFKRFEILKESAGLFGRGGAHVSGTSDYLKREDLAKEINEKIIPQITSRVIEILSPSK